MAQIEVRPLSNAIGAEILGVDLQKPLGAEVAKTIEEAWYKFVIILFRNQKITLEQQNDFAINFGKVAIRHQETATDHEKNTSNKVMLITNVRKNRNFSIFDLKLSHCILLFLILYFCL